MNLVNEGVLPPNEPDDRDERIEEREMAHKRETLAEIFAEYRNDADAMDRGWLYKPTTEYVRRLLDRIEAAWKRQEQCYLDQIRDAVNMVGHNYNQIEDMIARAREEWKKNGDCY